MQKFAFLMLMAFASLLPISAAAQPSEARLRSHIEILASDIFQGREPGTIGEAVASHYIAAQFAQAGLEPGHNGSFYQPVGLVKRRAVSADIWWRRGDGMSGDADTWLGPEQLAALGSEALVQIDAPLIFAGYASDLDDAESGLRQVDIEGAAIIVVADELGDLDDHVRFGQRRQMLADRGAAAVIGLSIEKYPWPALQTLHREDRRARLAHVTAARIEGFIEPETLRMLLTQEGLDLDDLLLGAQSEHFQAVRLQSRLAGSMANEIERYNGYNVVGSLSGTTTDDESVIFLAHYDHLGVCHPVGAEDRICNGAVDNASGTSAIIEIAHALAAGEPPQRNIVFLATTAEEQGLLGAQYYIDYPTVPLESIVGVLNLDMIAVGPGGEATGIVGRGTTPLDDIVDQASVRLGREVYRGLEPNDFVERQDGWAFASQGIPAVMVGESFVDPEALQAFIGSLYHSPGDEAGPGLELGGAFEDVLLHIEIGRTLANPQRYSRSAR